MTTYLTIDTSAGIVVGVARDNVGDVVELAQTTETNTRRHAENLAPMIEGVFAEAGISAPDAIIVGTGPGAFTGLRAGLVTARTLGHAWNVPVYGLSSLEVLALAAVDAGANAIVALIDARRREVFALRARAMGADDVEILTETEVAAPADVAEQLRRDPAVVVAASAELYPELGEERVTALQTPAVMTRLYLSRQSRIDAGETISLDTEPQYLRRPDVHGGAHAQPAATSNPYQGA